MSISMLNFETLLGFQCWSGGHSFNNTSFGVNIDISGTVVIEKKKFQNTQPVLRIRDHLHFNGSPFILQFRIPFP